MVDPRAFQEDVFKSAVLEVIRKHEYSDGRRAAFHGTRLSRDGKGISRLPLVESRLVRCRDLPLDPGKSCVGVMLVGVNEHGYSRQGGRPHGVDDGTERRNETIIAAGRRYPDRQIALSLSEDSGNRITRSSVSPSIGKVLGNRIFQSAGTIRSLFANTNPRFQELAKKARVMRAFHNDREICVRVGIRPFATGQKFQHRTYRSV